MGPLRIHPKNPRYFTDGSGRAIYLTGSHTWANLQDQGPKDPPPPFEYGPLPRLPARVATTMSSACWAWEQARWAPWSDGKEPNPADWFIRPNPYVRTGPGWPSTASRSSTWRSSTTRTSSVSACGSGRRASGDLRLGDAVPGLELGQELAGRHPVARASVPPRQQRAGLERQTRRRQRPRPRRPAGPRAAGAYIRKAVDTLNDLDNVLYEVTNEGGDKDWDRFRRPRRCTPTRRPSPAAPGRPHRHGSENNDEMLASPAETGSPRGRTSGPT